jgi:glutamine synthetase
VLFLLLLCRIFILQSVGVELEFCLVDAKTGSFVDDSVFANTITLNDQEAFLGDLYDQLQQQYIPVELVHSESGPGQLEIVLEHTDDPVGLADNVVLAKETVSAVARAHGLKALFLPKYDAMKAGNGMHVHLSIQDATTGRPLFCEQSSLTFKGGSFVEGLLEHLPAILGLTLPTVNSFRRVGPGCWTGSKVGWALEDKEVGVRVCSNLTTNEWDHVECKLVDASCNLYLGLAALLYSGLDGISRGLELRKPLSETSDGDSLPASLEEALEALQEDELLRQDLLGPRLSQGYLALRLNEAERSSKMTLEDEVREALARS